MAGQPKAPFYVVLGLVVVGLLGYAAFQARHVLFPQQKQDSGGKNSTIDPKKLGQSPEASDTSSVTTAKKYDYVPSERLPDVKGTSAYTLKDNTVRFALNVGAGWGPIILANDGFEPGKIWKTPDGKEFKIELVLIDDPVKMRDAYATGDVQIGWATLDMVPLFMDGFERAGDSRVKPRIFQQVDWSNGGDGIVVRENIKTVGDLRGKTITLAQNSPSQYFALNMLVAGGVQPSEVNWKYTADAFQAAAAFNSDKGISAAVSWAPDIYNLADIKGNRMLVTTQTANKLIADVWFARADFAKDNPGMIEAIVRGIFDGMEDMKKDEHKQRCAKLMAKGYSIPETETIKMFGDAHNTNWAENYQFFMNQNNPTNFERIWGQSYYLYKRIGSISGKAVSFDKVMDFSIIDKLGKEPKYANQKDEYQLKLTPMSANKIQAESNEIFTNTVVIHFFPNSWDLKKKAEENGKEIDQLFDPTVDATLEKIAQMTESFGAARVVIEGHTDSSMKGQVDERLVTELSYNRANAVKEALVVKFKLDPNKFSVAGMGWSRPADWNDISNHAKNRRVEIKVYPAEQK
jgi:NitT/TauT family transport system substrate-binding protein